MFLVVHLRQPDSAVCRPDKWHALRAILLDGLYRRNLRPLFAQSLAQFPGLRQRKLSPLLGPARQGSSLAFFSLQFLPF